MLNQILSQLVPVLITVIVGVLAVVIKAVGNAAISYIQTKEKEILQGIECSIKEDLINEALRVWQIVDEHFGSLTKNPFFQIRYKDYHGFPIQKFPFIILYYIDEVNKTIYILSVFNTSLNPTKYPK